MKFKLTMFWNPPAITREELERAQEKAPTMEAFLRCATGIKSASCAKEYKRARRKDKKR